MYKALDNYGNHVPIEKADSRNIYFCQCCLKELIVKNKGTIRAHHFAHKNGVSECTDSWAKEGLYEKSEWHRNWQNFFPSENQEVVLSFGEIKHIGDVVTDQTVIEFQHSPLSHHSFDKRTNFYHDSGCKVIWLFDLIDDFNSEMIYKLSEKEYIWTNKRRTFDYLDSTTGLVDIFFQLKEDISNQKCIVQVRNIKGKNFDCFEIDEWLTREEFLDYIGRPFLPPNLIKIDQDPDYQKFKEKYSLTFNPQQERAIQKTEGTTLLLAVPGSGKTTTLIGRLGYMTLCKGVDPKMILAITYSKSGAKHMREVFISKFGNKIGNQIAFRTIHSICYEIIGKPAICSSAQQKEFIRKQFYQTNNDRFPQETDLLNAASFINYVKNMMLCPDEIEEIAEANFDIPNLSGIYSGYENALKENKLIDFDDQLILALNRLKSNEKLLQEYQEKYRYVCVDEAQDTSLLQHEILKLICGKHNNVFFVGDEDQSIYGFRGSFPQFLLEIKNHYPNPFVLKLETNYRSNKEITDIANRFIARTPGRNAKTINSARGRGGTVEIIEVKDRIDQFDKILDKIKEISGQKSIIYRNNDSAIPLIDLFEREGVDYCLNRPNDTFFTSKIVEDIRAFLSFSINHNLLNRDNHPILGDIYYRFNLGFNKRHYERTLYWAEKNNNDLLSEFADQGKYYKKDEVGKDRRRRLKESSEYFKEQFEMIPGMKPDRAIEKLLQMGYERYALEKGYNIGTADLMQAIAKNTDTISDFLKRLDELERIVKNHQNDRIDKDVVLSTIHSAKGKEFDTVIIFDVMDGILPSRKSMELKNEEKFWQYAEERRLFYVAMTRAKNRLLFVSIAEEDSEFIGEIKGGIKPERTLGKANDHENNADDQVSTIDKYTFWEKWKGLQEYCVPGMLGDYVKILLNSSPIKSDDIITIFCKSNLEIESLSEYLTDPLIINFNRIYFGEEVELSVSNKLV